MVLNQSRRKEAAGLVGAQKSSSTARRKQRHCHRDQTPVEIKAAVISPEGIDLYSSRRSEKSAKLPPQEFLFIKPANRQKDKKPEILRSSKSALNYSALLCFRST